LGLTPVVVESLVADMQNLIKQMGSDPHQNPFSHTETTEDNSNLISSHLPATITSTPEFVQTLQHLLKVAPNYVTQTLSRFSVLSDHTQSAITQSLQAQTKIQALEKELSESNKKMENLAAEFEEFKVQAKTRMAGLAKENEGFQRDLAASALGASIRNSLNLKLVGRNNGTFGVQYPKGPNPLV
jgi:predicted RNase H-like nuclease (RuvC/YqgF family)